MKATNEKEIKRVIEELLHALNRFDVQTALTLFSTSAVIDDVSVGHTFKNTAGVREYFEKFFVGYHTKTRLDSLIMLTAEHAKAKVDFKGDFGHETGGLDVTVNAEGLITAIDAYLD